MVRKRKRPKKQSEISKPRVSTPSKLLWLRADYVAHVFHYRMPETVAIASINPLIPSPLTVKMAMIAVLLSEGRKADAENLVNYLPYIETKIRPPRGAMTFKAFLRYVRVPASPRKGLSTQLSSTTGGFYTSSPHIREYALWDDKLSVFVKTPNDIKEIIEETLSKISYLGTKDSLVTCLTVEQLAENELPPEHECACLIANSDDLLHAGNTMFRYADFAENRFPELRNLIPTQRDEADYQLRFYTLPGKLNTSGKTKIYRRNV